MVENSNFEWLNIDESELNYHLAQYENPKYYTLELLNIINQYCLFDDKNLIIDFGCGAGAVTNLFAANYPKTTFLGLDVNPKYIQIAEQKCENKASFQQFDLYKDINSLNIENVDGLISIQTISWLESYNEFVDLLRKISPSFCLLTSLFYDGMVDAKITLKDFTRKMGDLNYRSSNYNIYSINKFNEKLNQIGYHIEHVLPFEMPVDLPKNNNDGMSTYTLKTNNDKRLQISGPILMSWYSLIIKKI